MSPSLQERVEKAKAAQRAQQIADMALRWERNRPVATWDRATLAHIEDLSRERDPSHYLCGVCAVLEEVTMATQYTIDEDGTIGMVCGEHGEPDYPFPECIEEVKPQPERRHKPH